MYASPSRLPQPGALLNSYGLVVCVISGIKLDSYKYSSKKQDNKSFPFAGTVNQKKYISPNPEAH
jgi:hypothetical protein